MSTTSDGRALWCPNCDVLGRVTLLPERDRYSGKRSYKARCSACGYSIDDLGSDGTQTKAADEWQSLCEHAMQVKKQLLGETGMTEKQLELKLNVTAFIGLTAWFSIDAESDLPPLTGWYNVRFKMSDEEREERQLPPMRRWWSTKLQSFSWAVPVGEELDNAEINTRKWQQFSGRLDGLEWQGLAGPHPDLPSK